MGELGESKAWARMMRLKFSPPGMVREDGDINQDFFRPTKVSQPTPSVISSHAAMYVPDTLDSYIAHATGGLAGQQEVELG